MSPTKKELRECFEVFNHRYFDNRLFDVDVQWSSGEHAKLDTSKVCGYYEDNSYADYQSDKIVIARCLHRVSPKSGWAWKLVLLHEMVHMDLWRTDEIETATHPPEFNDAMLKLANAGALVNIW